MQCFKCGRELPKDSVFCPCCGTELNRMHFCSQCGAQLQGNNAFCGKCGKLINVDGEESLRAYDHSQEYMGVETEVSERKKMDKPLVVALWTVAILSLIALALIGWLLATRSAGAEKETVVLSPTEAAEQVLYLEIYDHLDNSIVTGSGFLVDDGLKLATNYHVIDNAHHIAVFDSDNNYLTDITQVLSYDADKDIALLQLTEPVDVLPLPLADSSQVQQGDKVYAVGYPLGLNNTLSDGIISSKFVENGVDTLQITAPVSSGSSGGALLNEDCSVIGIVFASYEDGQNMNFAIASNMLAEMLEQEKEATPLEELYLQTHPQLAFDTYKAEIQSLWVPDYDYADLIWEEWYYLDGSLSEVLELLKSYDEVELADYLENTEIIAPGEWSEAFDEWCFDPCRRLGDIEIFAEDEGYIICCYINAVGNETEVKQTEQEQSKEEKPAKEPQQEEPKTELCSHQYIWTTTKEATCMESGVKSGECEYCSEIVTETLPALGHYEVVDNNEVAATCTTQGRGNTSHCSRCGVILSAGINIPKIDHNYQKGYCVMCGEKDHIILFSSSLQGRWQEIWYIGDLMGYRRYTFNGNNYTYEAKSASSDAVVQKARGAFEIQGDSICFYPTQYTEDGKVFPDHYLAQNHTEEVWTFTEDMIVLDPGFTYYRS